MTKYVLSTATNSVSYAFYEMTGDLPVIRDKITIKGGAGIPSIRSGFGEMNQDSEGVPMWTADGVVTPVSDARYEMLKDHPIFKKHLDKGLVKVINSDITGNHKAVREHARDMTKRDGFAQMTPESLKAHSKVKINTESIDADIQFNQ